MVTGARLIYSIQEQAALVLHSGAAPQRVPAAAVKQATHCRSNGATDEDKDPVSDFSTETVVSGFSKEGQRRLKQRG